MIKEVKLPEVSDNIENGDVVKVLVSVGDTIEVDQPIIELETDKAMFEVPSTEQGTIKEINVKEGDVINIGQTILKVETNGKDESDTKEKGKDEKAEDKKVSKNGEDAKKNGVKKGAASENAEDQKEDGKTDEKGKMDKVVTEEVPEKESKTPEAKKKNENDKEQKKDKEEEEKIEDKETVSKKVAAASPSVRRLARELGVNIDEVNGSNEGGRISEQDVKTHVSKRVGGGGRHLTGKDLPDFSKWGEVDVQPMSKVRSITADSLSYAWSTIPMVTQFDKTDITQLEEFRKKLTQKIEHLTITSILVKVCTEALKEFPQFNSSIDFSSKEIYYKKYFNVGVAVDTDRGLLVPVIKNTDEKKITEISVELNELAEKARTKKITPDEMNGGNFTISNLGGIGGTNFTPIVYSPQVAILGVSRGSKEAVYVDDKLEMRLILPLSLTYDHRIIDGADAARFLRWICEALENPMTMML